MFIVTDPGHFHNIGSCDKYNCADTQLGTEGSYIIAPGIGSSSIWEGFYGDIISDEIDITSFQI